MEKCDILKDEYVALRTEICQSIAKQHQITLAGYGLTAAIIGYILGASSIDFRSLIVIPFIQIAMASLWAVECNRMVRASYYIGYQLWPSLCKIVKSDKIDGWETWIRIQDGNEGEFRKRQNYLQQIVIIFVPFLISLSATFIVFINVLKDKFWFCSIIAFGAFLILVWIFIYRNTKKISNLGAIVPKN